MFYRISVSLVIFITLISCTEKNPNPGSGLSDGLNAGTLLDSGLYYASNNIDKSQEFYQKAYKAAIESGDKKAEIKALANIGANYNSIDSINKASEYLILANETALSIDDKQAAAFTYSQLALIEQVRGHYTHSMEFFLKALKVYPENEIENILDDYDLRAPDEDNYKTLKIYGMIYNDLGLLYYETRDYQRAEQYFNKALQIGKVIDHRSRLAGTYSNLGMLHQKKGNRDEALNNYRKAARYTLDASNFIFYSKITGNISNILFKKGETDEALKIAQESMRYSKKMKNYITHAITASNIGMNYVNLNKLDSAQYYLDIAGSILENNSDIYPLSNYYKTRADFYVKKNMKDSAIHYLNKFADISDTLFNIERNRQFEQLKMMYDTENKEKEIIALKASRENESNIRTFLYVIISLVLIIAFNLYLLLRENKKHSKELAIKNRQLNEANQKLKEYGDNLQTLNDTKDRFFSIIAHDLKNPLGAFINIAEVLKNDYKDFSHEEMDDFLDELHTSSKRLYELLNNLLIWSRSQTGRIEYRPENVNVYNITANVLDVLKMNIKTKKIDIENKLPEDAYAYADPNMISTVMRNLISNAVKFTGEGGKVIIGQTQKNGNKLGLCVQDTGVGISEEDLAKLFRLDKTHTTDGTNQEKGTGLGLILCKEFIEKHDGEIKVESTPGKGSSFCFELPSS
ncbi:MAG: ATP-binding protein [Candidatus Kapaibacterium sp.]